MITSKNIRYFNFAKSVAEMSDFNRVHIGCIAVQGNRILSTGFNTNKSHPLQAHFNRFREFNTSSMCNHSLHAEIACLVPLWGCEMDWSKVDLYVYRIRKDIGQGLARPCAACWNAIKELGIKNVYYSTNYGFAHEYIN